MALKLSFHKSFVILTPPTLPALTLHKLVLIIVIAKTNDLFLEMASLGDSLGRN
jgi:hypothetical protein